MSNYRLKTVEENGQYTGYLLDDNQIVYKTPPQQTPNLASNLLTKHLNERADAIRASSQVIPSSPTTQIQQPQAESTPVNPAPAPRRCCGRA